MELRRSHEIGPPLQTNSEQTCLNFRTARTTEPSKVFGALGVMVDARLVVRTFSQMLVSCSASQLRQDCLFVGIL